MDGRLDEGCYRAHLPLSAFAVAGDPTARSQATRAWLCWSPEGLFFAFDVTDSNVVALPPSPREHDVDSQDRVEVFLWSGRSSDTYYCIEVGARGAVHDYAARFYRQFNDAWSPQGLKTTVMLTASGYCVEGEIPRAAVQAMGLRLQEGERLKAGLFRADFQPGAPDAPTWICWVDAHGPEPDFHVAGSFGTVVLAGASAGNPLR